MDYRTFTHDLENAVRELTDYIGEHNKKNLDRIDKAVEDYLQAMKSGNYSIKSYKAKIIHNELEHGKTAREISALQERLRKEVSELTDAYLTSDQTVPVNRFPTKLKDLREFVHNNRRRKHEVLSKKNNLNKERTQKLKEADQKRETLLADYNNAMNEIKTKLQNDLRKRAEQTIAGYRDSEYKLSDCNRKEEIEELKAQIMSVRLSGLTDEYRIKEEGYRKLSEEALKFNAEYRDLMTEREIYLNETGKKLLEYDMIGRQIDSESEFREKSYNYEQIGIRWDRFLEDIGNFTKTVREHNAFSENYKRKEINPDVIREEYTVSEKMFAFDVLSLCYYRLLLGAFRSDPFDPLTTVFRFLIESIKTLKNEFSEIMNGLEADREKKEKALLVALEPYEPKTRKNPAKEELRANVSGSLKRFYRNFITELDLFIAVAFDFLQALRKQFTIVEDFGKEAVFFRIDYHFVTLPEEYDATCECTPETCREALKDTETLLKEKYLTERKRIDNDLDDLKKRFREQQERISFDRDEAVIAGEGRTKMKTAEIDRNRREKDAEIEKTFENCILKAGKLFKASKKALR